MTGIEQPVEMDDEITHVGVIDGLLGLALPCRIGRGVVGEQTDDLDLVEILESHVIEVEKFAADDEVKQLRLHSFRHECFSQKPVTGSRIQAKNVLAITTESDFPENV